MLTPEESTQKNDAVHDLLKEMKNLRAEVSYLQEEVRKNPDQQTGRSDRNKGIDKVKNISGDVNPVDMKERVKLVAIAGNVDKGGHRACQCRSRHQGNYPRLLRRDNH